MDPLINALLVFLCLGLVLYRVIRQRRADAHFARECERKDLTIMLFRELNGCTLELLTMEDRRAITGVYPPEHGTLLARMIELYKRKMELHPDHGDKEAMQYLISLQRSYLN